ncbi:MAG TPA: TonB-dependent receptor [Candidatus Baltobacteraceae bacterium]|jgi:hypothetical protein
MFRTWHGSIFSALTIALSVCTFGTSQAQTLPTVTGHVRTSSGQPIADAAVALDGAIHLATKTDARGTFTFGDLKPGTYVVRISKAGFAEFVRNDLSVAQGTNATVDVTLTASSFSSLQVIGQVSTALSGKIPLNQTPAALQIIPVQDFVDQGSTQVTKLLEEAPGVTLTSNAAGGGSNNASLGAPEYPQLRGALYYETESLIDGHPVSVGALGTFNPLLVLPALLQNVEIAEGPGSMPDEINYAVGGTINYRTLDPTIARISSFTIGTDQYGGIDTSARATGSFSNGKVEYALAYGTVGTPGPLQNYPIAGSPVWLAFGKAPWTINGQQVLGIPVYITPSQIPNYVGGPGTSHFSEPVYLCCTPVNTDYNARAELAKLRFNFSQQTTLTVSYLGGQSGQNYTGSILGSGTPVFNFSTFAPPAGYTGSVPAGVSIPFDTQANTNYYEYLQQNLFQAELRTTIGENTLLARAYGGYDSTVAEDYTPGQPATVTEKAWGGIALCPTGDINAILACVTPGGAPVPSVETFFNGQPVTLGTADSANYTILTDHVRGYSLEADRLVGDVLLTLAADRSNHDSYEFAISPTTPNTVVLPPGSSQQFTTFLSRALVQFTPGLSMTLGTYLTSYASHYTGNGGMTWSDATHTQTIPRLALLWHPDVDSVWRFSAGGSIAPPYISLLSSPGSTPIHDPPGAAQGYFVNANNGQIAPEQAFGFDLGYDRRLQTTLRFSTDFYFTHLRNMFLTETSQQGTYAAPTGPSAGIAEPLYVTETENLGNARYEGVEVHLDDAPRAGFGFKAQGSLQRAFAYDLSPGFYSTTSGPFTTNLGVIPNINFQASGNGFNAISPGRVPYSQGYGELNFRSSGGMLALLGCTYFGPNNSYNEPAFEVFNASLRFPVARSAWIQLSANNLTDIYGNAYSALVGGVPVPLINGKLGAIAGSNVGPTSFQLMLHETVR